MNAIEPAIKLSTTLAALVLAVASIGSADAAVITFQTGYSAAGVQSTAAGYQSAVDYAVAYHQYGSATLSNYDVVSNQSLFHAGASDIAFKSVITFGVSAADAGAWSFRAGVDFGRGGALFLDGVAVDMKTNDMWWAGSYVNTDSIFQASKTLAAGTHTLALYGLEGCCDGGQQVQYQIGSSGFQSFSAGTLNVAAVPEPETYAMLLGGLGMVGALARRRQRGYGGA